MTHVITSLCIRDGGCVSVCPVDCIVPEQPQETWPLFYIDPDICIDCGACIRVCPYKAIYPEDEVPIAYHARGGEVLSAPLNTAGFDQITEIRDFDNHLVKLFSTRQLSKDQEINLTPNIALNRSFFSKGPGYEYLKR